MKKIQVELILTVALICALFALILTALPVPT